MQQSPVWQPENIFPQSFQWTVLKLMLHDPTFYRQVRPHLPVEFFSKEVQNGEYLVRAVELVYSHMGSGLRAVAPNRMVFETLCAQHCATLDDQWRGSYIDAFNGLTGYLYDHPWHVGELEFVQEKTFEWVRQRAEMSLLVEAKRAIDQNQNLGQIDLIERAREISRIGIIHDDIGIDLFGTEEATWRALSTREVRSCIPTGNENIDKVFSGGHGRKELTVYEAPPNTGKTTVMAAFASKFLLRGFKGVYISCEQSDLLIMQKVMASISGIDPNQWFTSEVNTMHVWRWAQWLTQHSCRLAIVQFVAGKATTMDVETYLLNVQAQWGAMPDFCIVDYADLLGARRPRDQKRIELLEIYTDLRSIGQELDLAMITASQSNRSSVGKERIGIEDLTECFEKASVADVIVAICQTEEEQRDNLLRLFFAKNRIGPKFREIPMTINYALSMLEVNEMRMGLQHAHAQAVQNFDALARFGQKQNA